MAEMIRNTKIGQRACFNLLIRNERNVVEKCVANVRRAPFRDGVQRGDLAVLNELPSGDEIGSAVEWPRVVEVLDDRRIVNCEQLAYAGRSPFRDGEARWQRMNRSSEYSTVRAFTLFESVVAITIISILIGIGTMIYGNLVEAERPVAYYQAKEEVDLLFKDLKETKAFFSKNYDYETFSIQQKVDFHKGNKNLYQVEYTINAQGKKWWNEKHLIANHLNE